MIRTVRWSPRVLCAGFVAVLWLCAGATNAADWPQFLGPARNGTVDTAALADSWPAGGPPALWTSKVGAGFAGPVVAGERLVLFHRQGNEAIVDCLDAASGTPLWTSKYPTDYRDAMGFDEGPRATPAIHDGRVYTFGAEGVLSCRDLADGKVAWSADTRALFKPDKGFFGPACSPLVEQDLVVLHVGGRDGAGIVAFDRLTGTVRWKSTGDEAGYASPIAATVAGKRLLLCFTRAGLNGLDPATGAARFTFPFRSRSHASVNAATPLVVGDEVFLSSSYGTGAILLKLAAGQDPKEVWSGDDILSNHYATSVHHAGHLYGFDGRQEQTPRLRCVEWKTGKVKWTEENFGAGTLLAAGEKLIILTEGGELVTAPATPEGFKSTGRAKVLPKVCRAHPALAGGLLFARDEDTLVCIDLRHR